jgi:hypothetical protein
MARKKTLQEDLEALGVPMGNHETDLQVVDTPAVRRVIAKHGKRVDGHNVVQFRNEVEGGTWLEIPFAYVARTPAERVLGKRGAAKHREPVDEHAATELELYIENDYELVGKDNSLGKNIEAMLMKKVKRGNFDMLPSVKAWMYLIDAGAKKYAKEFSSSERDWPRLFNKATREKVATRFARHWAQENAGLAVQ